MALPTSLKLFIDTINGVAYPSFTSNSAITNPVFYAGDKAKLEIYLIQPTDNPNYPKAELPYDAGLTIKAAVGNIDADPTGGTWKIGYGSDTTGELNYNATVSSLSTALNALASITADGGVAVSTNAGLYIITFNTVGAKQLLTTDPSKLTPVSAAAIIELQAGDANKPAIYAIHLQQTVVAYTNTFTPVSAAAASVSELAAWNGSTVTYRLVLNPDPKDGTFILNYNSAGDVSSSSTAIPVDATSLEIQNGLARGDLDNKVLVNQVGAYSWDLTISLEPDAGLTADSSGIISYTGWIGELNFNTAHVIGLLNSAESVEAHLEVEITAATKPLTVLQLGCTIRASVIDEAAVEPLALDTYLTLSQAESEFLKLTGGTLSGGLTINGDLSMSGTNGIYDVINLSTAQISFDDGSTQVTAGLPLIGGIMSGAIRFDAVGTQNISKGTFNSDRGGYNGISLICAVDYELNWQAGYLKALNSSGFTTPINVEDSSVVLIQNRDGVEEDIPPYIRSLTITGNGINQVGNNDIGDYSFYLNDGGAGGVNNSDTNWAINTTGVAGATDAGDSEWYLNKNGVNGYRYDGGVTWAFNETQVGSSGYAGTWYYGLNGAKFSDGSVQLTAALPLTGGTMAYGANLNFANTEDYISSLNSSRIEFTESGNDNLSTLNNKQLALTDEDGVLLVKSTGITFPDLSVQSTAAVSSVFSTSTQAQVGTSSTTVISPATLLDARYMAGGRYIGYITFTAATSGAGASATTGFIKAVNAPNFSTGYGQAYIALQNGQRGQIYNTGIDFTKKIVMGVRLCRIQAGTVDANSVFRCNLGRSVPLTTAGDLSTRGIGVRFVGNTGALELQVHNGTTLYNVTSTFTPVYNQAFDVVITSDGAGLATLYVNGVSVATSTNAPTTLLGGNASVLLVEAQNTATITNSPMQVNCSDQFLHIPPV